MQLPSFDLTQWFSDAEGRFDCSLGHSSCESPEIRELLGDEDWKDFGALKLEYGDFAGFDECRREVAKLYETIDAEDVTVLNGPGEVIYTFMQSMLSPGDKIVAASPLFFTLHSIARHIGCEVVDWRATDDFTCEFDVSRLRELCDDSTKLIVINFPHNPTGQMISESELREIVEIAKSANAILLSDEVFRLLEFPPVTTLPAACDLYDQAVSIGGMSKPFGMGGLRVGWVATKCDRVRQSLQEYRFNSAEMTNTPCQWLTAKALQRKDHFLDRNRRRISENLSELEQFVDAHSSLLTLSRPKAGTMAMVKQQTALTSTQFCQRILEEQRLFMIPGQAVGMSDRLLRIGLGRSGFSEGLERLDRFLKNFK